MKEKKEVFNYHEDLMIDPYNLDEATEQQPTIYMRWGKLSADKTEEVNEQKKVIKLKEAELKEESAKLYIEFSGERIKDKAPTKDMIMSKIEVSESYKKKFREVIKEIGKLNNLIKQKDILEVAVTAFQHRKNMIEERITLHLSGYNSGVKQKNYKDRINDRLNKKTKNNHKEEA